MTNRPCEVFRSFQYTKISWPEINVSATGHVDRVGSLDKVGSAGSAGRANASRWYQQAGSALVETTVLMVVMLPLVYAVAMLGKVIDLKQTNEQASRYAAWEATVYPASGLNGTAPSSLEQRFFGDPDDLVQTAVLAAGVNPLWGSSGTASESRFESETRVAVKPLSVASQYVRDISDPTVAMRIGHLAAQSGEVLDGLPGNSWDLTVDGLMRADVSAEVDAGAWLTGESGNCGPDQSSLCLNSQAVILVDGWSASDDAQAERRVRSLMPASALEPLGNAVSVVGNLPMFKELKGLHGAFGHVDMQVLPEYAKP